MSETTIRKFKWFWAWADDKEEAWLRQMAQQGLHLGKAAPFGEYLFVQGEPRDVVYRLDYVPMNKKDEHYYQLFKDAGWEYVGEMMSWQYWRKEATGGKADEIFTDHESKVMKYRRLLGWLAILFLPVCFSVLNLRDAFERYEHWGIKALYVLILFIFFIYLYAFVRLLLRIRRLKRL